MSDNNLVLTSDGGVVKSIDTSSWDKDSSDDFGAWMLDGDSGTAESIGSGNTATFVGGSGITTAVSATDTLTVSIDNGNGIVFESGQVAVDESYAFAWTGAQSWSSTADFNGNVSIADTDIALDGASTTLTVSMLASIDPMNRK